MPARLWLTRETRQDLATAGALFAFFLAVLFLGIGCATAQAAPVLAAVPWQGVGYHNHVGWHRVPLGTTGIVIVRPSPIPICLHMNWRLRRSMQPAEGTLIA